MEVSSDAGVVDQDPVAGNRGSRALVSQTSWGGGLSTSGMITINMLITTIPKHAETKEPKAPPPGQVKLTPEASAAG